MVPPEEMTNDNPAYDSLEYWAKKIRERAEELEYLDDNAFNAEVLYLYGMPPPYNKEMAPYLDPEDRDEMIDVITQAAKKKKEDYLNG